MEQHISPDPHQQFEAARTLRGAGWSFFRISAALGISLSQARVACDKRAANLHHAWIR